jgi:CRISPR-associated protein Csc3
LLNELTNREFESFITSGIQGIKVDPKCLELGTPFATLWNVVHNRVQTRTLKRNELLPKIVDRTTREFAKRAAADPETAAQVRQQLNNPQTLLPDSSARLRDGELIRTYYIFLSTHLAETIPDAWSHIYDLLDVPAEARARLAFFDARWDRPYVFAHDLTLTSEALYDVIEADGAALLGQTETTDDKADLLDDYLTRYALFGPPGRMQTTDTRRFEDHLRQYVATQHRQCVHCSTVFPTDRWMTNDVRSDITVQTFSNRLRGGPGEPKKFICRLCQLQFLVERLNYEEVRGEDTMYLHFFPYGFLPAPYLTAMREVIDEIRQTDAGVRALWCDTHTALLEEAKGIDPRFATQTKKGKPHPYGVYMPRVARNTVGNQLIFPINPAGANDSSRFLFALWNALVLQEYLGLRVMLTESPVAPFTPDSDLYIDNVALSCRGLVGRNDYPEFADLDKPDGERPLRALRQQAVALHRIVDRVRTTGERDEMLALVQAMAVGPLHLYYAAEKLLEGRVREQKKASSPEWLEIRLSQQIFDDLQSLVHSKGGRPMAELSDHLQQLATIAWQRHLRGKSLKKNSLVMPLDEIFQKLGQSSGTFDEAALKAVIVEDIFEYLDRIADEYHPGRRAMEAATEFVDIFFSDIVNGVYRGNRTRLLADEKPLRSAFMFYMRQQIPRKSGKPGEDEGIVAFNDVSEA